MSDPYLSDPDVTLYLGDALDVLRTLPAESVHCCVTSPPFYGLRDYQTGTWEGGDPDCDHLQSNYDRGTAGSRADAQTQDRATPYRDVCGKCGARRVDQQIGLEATPEQWLQALVAVFREVRRVLRPEGTLWLEVGDSYAGSGPTNHGGSGSTLNTDGRSEESRLRTLEGVHENLKRVGTRGTPAGGCKPKDLIGAPWMLAFALRQPYYVGTFQNEKNGRWEPLWEPGWYLRSDIIWARPNPMPESVTDRPTKSHSYVFLLAKQPRYYYDAEALREGFSPNTHSTGRNSTPGSDDPNQPIRSRNNHDFQASVGARHVDFKPPPQTETLDGFEGEAPRGPDGRRQTHVTGQDGSIQHRDGERWPGTGRNCRSVWSIPTQPFSGAHFAAFPEALARRCILAGTSEHGCCPECGAPWQRQTEHAPSVAAGTERNVGGRTDGFTRPKGGAQEWSQHVAPRTLGWRPACECGAPWDPELVVIHRSPVPCVVLDPFVGSGTVPMSPASTEPRNRHRPERRLPSAGGETTGAAVAVCRGDVRTGIFTIPAATITLIPVRTCGSAPRSRGCSSAAPVPRLDGASEAESRVRARRRRQVRSRHGGTRLTARGPRLRGCRRDRLRRRLADEGREGAARQAREQGKIALLGRQAENVLKLMVACQNQLNAIDEPPPFFKARARRADPVWQEENGVVCRAWLTGSTTDHSTIDDLKTTKGSATPTAWIRNQLYAIGADVQVAFYLRGLEKLTGKQARFRFVVVETSPPYAVSVVSLGPAALISAQAKVEHAINRWGACLKSGKWPGIAPYVQYADLPAWEEMRTFEWRRRSDDLHLQAGET